MSVIIRIWQTFWYVISVVFLLLGTIYILWASSKRGDRAIRRLPVKDDPDGNDNIKRKFWDYM